MPGPAIPVIIMIGGVLVRATAKNAPRILRRFKNAKEIKNPSKNQIEKAKSLSSPKSKRDQKILDKADSAKPNIVQSITGKGRTLSQKKMQPVVKKQGEAKRARDKAKVLGVGLGAFGFGAGVATNPKVQKKVTSVFKPKTTTVKKGDTLSQIAKDKNTTLAAIKKANPNITNLNKIKPGQVIKLR